MLSYCLKYRKNTESKTQKVVKTKNERIMLYQTMQFAKKKNQKSSKSKKLVDYRVV